MDTVHQANPLLSDPSSLYDMLTRLHQPQMPPTSLAIDLLKTLAATVSRACRNTQQLYRITARARDLCDGLNGILVSLDTEEDNLEALRIFKEFRQRLEIVERPVS